LARSPSSWRSIAAFQSASISKHHCAHNRHHPEFFGEDGVDGMTLVDLILLRSWHVEWVAQLLDDCDDELTNALAVKEVAGRLS
jgi:hypothetical protein